MGRDWSAPSLERVSSDMATRWAERTGRGGTEEGEEREKGRKGSERREEKGKDGL